jgi:hypothetical protein
MQTVPSNLSDKVLSQIKTVKCFSLSNHFSGEQIEPSKFLPYMDRMKSCKPRVRFDKATGQGNVKFHSNEWYEFTVV